MSIDVNKYKKPLWKETNPSKNGLTHPWVENHLGSSPMISTFAAGFKISTHVFANTWALVPLGSGPMWLKMFGL
eukprot:4873711-Amphidinium_carterae.1